jgi:radical SAM superfamily enzyme YgiQ (UPF0313 family)
VKIHLVNPSHVSFGTAVITPCWMYVIAAATPASFGDPILVDETVHPLDPGRIQPGDVVGISIHTENALRGYEIGTILRDRGAYVIFGGIHATLYPEEARTLGGAHAVVLGDGELVWATALEDCSKAAPQSTYLGGRVEASSFVSARWDLVPRDKYMWASVQTVRGCPKHCSFCSVWKTDGQRPRQRASDGVIEEIVQLRRLGFRFVLLADDNFYPVTLTDLQLASRQGDIHRIEQLKALRAERFELMARLALLPADMVFFTQITMEASEDPSFLEAMRKANIKGVLVGIESVTPEGLKDVYKDFNSVGSALVERLRAFRRHNVYVLGSFIFGLPSDRPETFEATVAVAQSAEIAFAQFLILIPFPGTVDFAKWEKMIEGDPTRISGVPLNRRWLIPELLRPKMYWPHPVMSGEEIRRRTQAVWDRFYSLKVIWKRSSFIKSLRNRLAFVLISKLYRQMYANTGLATDSARVARSARWARWIAKPCRHVFSAHPMPQLQVPQRVSPSTK